VQASAITGNAAIGTAAITSRQIRQLASRQQAVAAAVYIRRGRFGRASPLVGLLAGLRRGHPARLRRAIWCRGALNSIVTTLAFARLFVLS